MGLLRFEQTGAKGNDLLRRERTQEIAPVIMRVILIQPSQKIVSRHGRSLYPLIHLLESKRFKLRLRQKRPSRRL